MDQQKSTVRTHSIYGRPSRWKRILFAWIRNPAWDLLSAIPIAIWALAAHKLDGPLILQAINPEIRRALYQNLFSLAATLIGLNLASIAFLVNLMQTPLKTLDNLLSGSQKQRIGSSFLALLPSLGTLFTVSLVGLLIDSLLKEGYWVVGALAMTTLLWASFSLARIAWVISKILGATGTGAR